MKKTVCVTLCLLLGLFSGTSFATEVIVFGPNQYVRTTGSPDVFTNSFTAISGSGTLIVKNGAMDGNNRITDAISSASVYVNGEQIFGTSDFKQNVYLLQAPVNLIQNNSITVEMGSSPGSYLTIEITEDIDPLTVSLSADPDTIQTGESSALTWSSTHADTCVIEPDIGSVDVNGSTTVFPTQTTTYTLTASGLGGTANDQAVVTVEAATEPQPEGSFGEQYQDLIPPDATAYYNPTRFALITGLVQALDRSPISNVSITIHGYSEYGSVSTDAEGRFSIPVNGGGAITLVYQKQGLITAHRKVYVPWNDIAIAETIQMITEDSVSSKVVFDGNPETVVIHQSTEVTDEFGSRSCSMVFTGDNQAYEVDVEGNIIGTLTTITTRVTEYITPESMPAKLPPNSAYTYCAELSVDGVQRVKFDMPVVTWVDNFLGFNVGEIVPVGYYDRDRGVWIPSDNGVVVKLLDTNTDGIVDALDADGDDQPDDFNENGLFSDEVTGLDDPIKYPPGSTLWRVEMTHFSPADWNWPFDLPPDATEPKPGTKPISDQQNEHDDKSVICSYVEDRSRIFHEDNISIPGTDVTFHYSNNRVNGYKTLISVPSSGGVIPSSLKNIIVKMDVAGRSFQQTLNPQVNQITEFIWDGLDYLGRPLGSATAHINIGFVYDVVYMSGASSGKAFARAGIGVTGIPSRQEAILCKRSNIQLGKGKSSIAEGWNLSNHHYLSPMDLSILHKGDGTIAKNLTSIIDTVGGDGTHGCSGDGVPATEAQMDFSWGITVDASGNLYISDIGCNCIRKIDTSGIITTVAGNGTYGYSGDGGPATQAELDTPMDVAVDTFGNLYIVDSFNASIRKVDTNGIITTVAGNGTYGYSGDGGPATQAQLYEPGGVTVDTSGNLYIADTYNYRIRKVDTSGIINTVAGNGGWEHSGDGGPATEAQFGHSYGVAVDDSGNLYIADYYNSCIRKVDTSGIITTVTGNGTYGYGGDGGFATQAELNRPIDVVVDHSGNLFITDTYNNRIRKVDNSGIITTVAGNGTWAYGGDGGPATQAEIKGPYGVAVDDSGNLYIEDTYNFRIRKISSSIIFDNSIALGDMIFAEKGIGHIMSSSGLHKNTIDLHTGVSLREFGYDQDNNLISIADQFSNAITIQRDANGIPTAIVSPDGITTNLTIDANNHLTRITYPDGSFYRFEYNTDGLATAKIQPEGNRFDHVFDANGRIIDFTDEEGGHWQFSRSVSPNGNILAEVLTGEGNVSTYLDYTYSTDAYTSTSTEPTGAETLFDQSEDGLTVNKFLPSGIEFELKYGLDPETKFKFVKEMTESTPAALEKITLRDKTYQDTDSDDIPDLITETVTVNDKSFTLENKVLQSQKTITSPEWRTVTTLYDPVTLVTESMSVPGLFDTTYGYDTKGRLTSVDTNTRGMDLTYNAHGFVESITDSENYTTSYSYDPVGRMIGINRPDTTSIGFTYDDNGNMTVLTNPSTINHGFGFNKVNLNSSYQTPLSGSYNYVYDKDRRLKQINFPSGNQINNVYANGRLEHIQTPEGNVDFTYLCGTKVGSITNGTESISYGYDGKLVTSEALAGTLSQSLGYTYNNDFNLTGLTYAGETTNYSYDNDGLLTGAGNFTITRNAGNGLPESVTGGSLSLSRTFNGYGEVDAQDFTVSGQNPTSWTLMRDNNGRITQKTETVDGATSHYDYTYYPMGRLMTVTKDSTLVEEYQYDANGTRIYEMNSLRGITGRSFSYDNEDHLLTAGTDIYQYDLDGFLTSKTDGTDVTTYDYSSRGELLSVMIPDGRFIEYVHDPLGRRIAKKVDGVTVEKYLWQGLTRLLTVYDGSDNLLMRFEYADGRMPVAMTKGGSTYYLTFDQVGSLRIVEDASGNVVKRIDYDSFGNIIDDTNPAFNVPFGFAGGLHDRETGLVRFGYRDYDPVVGRWTAKDPILFAGGDTDLYGYVLNDPVNLIDPLGLINVPTPNLTKGQKTAITKAVLGASAIVGGALTLPEGAPVLAVGIPVFAEGLTLSVVEFIFKGDTSGIPSIWDVFRKTAEGIYNSTNPCNK